MIISVTLLTLLCFHKGHCETLFEGKRQVIGMIGRIDIGSPTVLESKKIQLLERVYKQTSKLSEQAGKRGFYNPIFDKHVVATHRVHRFPLVQW